MGLKYLKQINSQFYSFFHAANGMFFTLKCGDRGVYGMGKAYSPVFPVWLSRFPPP